LEIYEQLELLFCQFVQFCASDHLLYLVKAWTFLDFEEKRGRDQVCTSEVSQVSFKLYLQDVDFAALLDCLDKSLDHG
jgi:hypothetical protein